MVGEAFSLTRPEKESLLAALWPRYAYPWLLWKSAYEKFWKKPISEINNETCGRTIPYFDTPQEMTINFHRQYLEECLNDFIALLPFNIFMIGIIYINEQAYSDPTKNIPADLRQASSPFFEVEQKFSLLGKSHQCDYIFEVRDFKIDYGSRQIIAALLDAIFYDVTILEKFSALEFLQASGMPFVKETKGVTRFIVDYNIDHLLKKIIDCDNKQVKSVPNICGEIDNTVCVPRSVWSGKTKEHIISTMRALGFDVDAIAHVLLQKRQFKLSKRELAEMLVGSERSESSLDKTGKEIMAQAMKIQVIDSPE